MRGYLYCGHLHDYLYCPPHMPAMFVAECTAWSTCYCHTANLLALSWPCVPPGALELRNHPTALRNLVTPSLRPLNPPGKPPTKLLDIGAVDVFRSREARVPLFNDYLKVGWSDVRWYAYRTLARFQWQRVFALPYRHVYVTSATAAAPVCWRS